MESQADPIFEQDIFDYLTLVYAGHKLDSSYIVADASSRDLSISNINIDGSTTNAYCSFQHYDYECILLPTSVHSSSENSLFEDASNQAAGNVIDIRIDKYKPIFWIYPIDLTVLLERCEGDVELFAEVSYWFQFFEHPSPFLVREHSLVRKNVGRNDKKNARCVLCVVNGG